MISAVASNEATESGDEERSIIPQALQVKLPGGERRLHHVFGAKRSIARNQATSRFHTPSMHDQGTPKYDVQTRDSPLPLARRKRLLSVIKTCRTLLSSSISIDGTSQDRCLHLRRSFPEYALKGIILQK